VGNAEGILLTADCGCEKYCKLPYWGLVCNSLGHKYILCILFSAEHSHKTLPLNSSMADKHDKL